MSEGITGGLLSGIVQGMQQGAQMKQQKEQNKLKIQMAKQQMDQAKIAAEEDKFWREKLFPGGMPGQTTTETAPSSETVLGDGYNVQEPPQQQQSLLETLTPLQAAYVQKKTGIDILKAMTTATSRGKGRTETRMDEQGNTWKVFQDPITGQEISEPQIISRQKPVAETYQEGGKTLERFVNPMTRQPMGGPRIKTELKGMSGEAAGKMGMLRSGAESIEKFKGRIIREDGSINRALLATMKTNLPFSEGRLANSEIADALESKIRIESGAAVPEEEVRRLHKRLKPSIADNDEAIRSKVNRLDSFLNSTIELLDPNKNYGKGVEILKGEDNKKYVVIPPSNKKIKTADDFLKAKGF